jgi:hypothetical protein
MQGFRWDLRLISLNMEICLMGELIAAGGGGFRRRYGMEHRSRIRIPAKEIEAEIGRDETRPLAVADRNRVYHLSQLVSEQATWRSSSCSGSLRSEDSSGQDSRGLQLGFLVRRIFEKRLRMEGSKGRLGHGVKMLGLRLEGIGRL